MERLVASTARAPMLAAVPLSVCAGPNGVGGRARSHGRAQLRQLLWHVGKERVDELVDEVRVAADHLEQAVEGGLVQDLSHRRLR